MELWDILAHQVRNIQGCYGIGWDSDEEDTSYYWSGRQVWRMSVDSDWGCCFLTSDDLGHVNIHWDSVQEVWIGAKGSIWEVRGQFLEWERVLTNETDKFESPALIYTWHYVTQVEEDGTESGLCWIGEAEEGEFSCVMKAISPKAWKRKSSLHWSSRTGDCVM